MIYLDTSVVLAQLFSEDRVPAPELWRSEGLVASRLLEYEVWNRIHAREAMDSHGETARLLLGGIAYLELRRPVVARALDVFPVPVRTLDALHLASADFLRSQGQTVVLASYDRRLLAAAEAMGFELSDLV